MCNLNAVIILVSYQCPSASLFPPTCIHHNVYSFSQLLSYLQNTILILQQPNVQAPIDLSLFLNNHHFQYPKRMLPISYSVNQRVSCSVFPIQNTCLPTVILRYHCQWNTYQHAHNSCQVAFVGRSNVGVSSDHGVDTC